MSPGPRRTLIALALALAGCGLAPGCGLLEAEDRAPQESPLPARSGSLTILYTGDIHGNYAPSTDRGPEPRGGFAALDERLRGIRAEGRPLLLMDAGDLMTGHPVCDMEFGGVEGGAMPSLMSALDYDVWTLGNHEFDKGRTHLTGLLGLIRFPTLSANLVVDDEAGSPIPRERWRVFERGGLRIGVVGIMTTSLPTLINRDSVPGVSVAGVVQTAREAVEALDPVTDLIVLLTHQGADNDRELAARLEGVDVIVGGHSHSPIEVPEVIHGVIVVQDEAKLRRLGRLDLEVADDRVIRHQGWLLPLPAHGAHPRPEVASILDHIESTLGERLAVVVGTLGNAWRRSYYAESNLGDYVADAMRSHTEAAVAFINSGGLRKDLEAGPITLGDLYEILPFTNSLVTFEATGEQLLALARHNASASARESHGVLQLSGLSYRWRRVDGAAEVLDARVGGKPVDPAATYLCATNSFIVEQAAKYMGFLPAGVKELGQGVTEVFVAAVTGAEGPIQATTDGRLVELK
ncbi:MAG: bifunctional metallophosphatase/5'-nucleotidase [Planctomycetes bacterium]|nr:bifunctional metallophosphatase/5'-nucleotidase [Planctomycetota bacterium]